MSVTCTHNVKYIAGRVHVHQRTLPLRKCMGVRDFVLFSASYEYDGVFVAIY